MCWFKTWPPPALALALAVAPCVAQVLTIDGTPASFAVNEGKVAGNTLTLLDDQHADVDASALGDFGLGDFSIQLTVAGLGTGADPSPDGAYFTVFIKSGDKVPSPFDGPSAFVWTDTHCTTFDNWRKAHHKVDGKDPFLPAFVDGTKYGATLSWSQCLDLCSKSGGTSSGACKQVMFTSTHNNRPGRGLLFECTLLTLHMQLSPGELPSELTKPWIVLLVVRSSTTNQLGPVIR